MQITKKKREVKANCFIRSLRTLTRPSIDSLRLSRRSTPRTHTDTLLESKLYLPIQAEQGAVLSNCVESLS